VATATRRCWASRARGRPIRANVIARAQKPALVMAHNKTLAAQLCNEFKEFLPDNAVEYFVSYYDYYQPEAYLPATDTYIEKDTSIYEEIDWLRHAATSALLSRRDVVIVASVVTSGRKIPNIISLKFPTCSLPTRGSLRIG